MGNTKNACFGYGILWIVTIALRWVISDPEGTLSDLLTFWIIHPVAVAVTAGYIASEGMTLIKWLFPIGLGLLYALIYTFTSALQSVLYTTHSLQSLVQIFPMDMFRNGLIFSLTGTVVGIIIYRVSLRKQN